MENTMKRFLDLENDSDAKRAKIEPREILDFSDCVLSVILSYLKPYDLYCLSKTCQRFKYLIKERKLWRRIDVLDHPMCARKFKFFFDNLNSSTEMLMVSGISKKEKTLTFSQFIKLCKVCDNLTVLAIENQYINSDEIGLKDFPESLKELSLRGTHIYGRQPFLQDANLRLHKLHTLILDDCKWFHEHSLMALSKLCSLENLSLYKCGNLNDSVAYMSITAKFGFRKLLRIDARCTSIGDQFLKCFHCIKTLREIYLEAPQRRENKKKPLFDELRRLCSSDTEETPNAIVYNRSNIFKLRRDLIKSIKKPKKIEIPLHQLIRRESFNCLETCEKCTMETCSFIPTINNSESTSQTSDTQKTTESLSSQEITDSSSTINCGSSSSNVELSSGSKLTVNHVSGTLSLNNNSEDDRSQLEIFFCDDVSDSEDEMVDFEIFHSDVTDNGVQWFCTSDPDATDNLGNESFLFRKPYKDCVCEKKEENGNDIDKAGPSGVSFQGPSKHKHLPKKTTKKRSAREALSNDSSSSDDSPPEGRRNPPEARRFHNDVTVNVSGQGSLCLKIAYDSSDDESENNGRGPTPNSTPDSPDFQDRLTPPLVFPNFTYDPHNPRPRFDPPVVRGRDLRVIIERLDPGVHIVYDQGGRVQYDNYMRDYTTKLKVFVARGYKLITNHALRSLMDLRLELLDVTGTSVSARGVREFLMVNPDCRVIHESTCGCN